MEQGFNKKYVQLNDRILSNIYNLCEQRYALLNNLQKNDIHIQQDK